MSFLASFLLLGGWMLQLVDGLQQLPGHLSGLYVVQLQPRDALKEDLAVVLEK